MDFTIIKYKKLLESLVNQGYSFQSFDEFIKNPLTKSIILRHDVDLFPENSLRFAKIQNKYGVCGTYYFRAVPESWDEDIIIKISKLGHEIGYHYENLSMHKNDYKKAIEDFKNNLYKLRELVPVSTICMHGSPMSKFDSKNLWKKYNYSDFDIVGEPYFDIDFNKVFYLTDTGRRWDGQKVSVRDKVETGFNQTYSTTDQIIKASLRNELPNKIMINFHPQRWHDSKSLWMKEYIFQKVKNIIKKIIYVK